MPAYNLTKPEDRERLREDRQAELDATLDGTWPRDINDAMRWTPPKGVRPIVWAARICLLDLEHLGVKRVPERPVSCPSCLGNKAVPTVTAPGDSTCLLCLGTGEIENYREKEPTWPS